MLPSYIYLLLFFVESDEGKDGLGDIQGDDDSGDGGVNKINKLEDPKGEQGDTPKLKANVPDITSESRKFK